MTLVKTKRAKVGSARCLFLGIGLLGLGLALPAHAVAEEEFLPIDEYIGPDGLTGDSIYQSMLDNRFESYGQRLVMRSGDQGGNFQLVEVGLKYKRYDPEKKGILSKTIAKYFEPHDVRHLGYLIINKEEGQDDQFVYRPSSRKVRRVNVRGESIMGTDFAFEDVVPPEFEDGTHHRMPDEDVEDRKVFVVTHVPNAATESEYSKLVIYIDKERFIPLRTWYWDNKRVLVKRLDADLSTINKYEGNNGADGKPRTVWIAERSSMKQLKTGSFTELEIENFEADPKLRDRDFSQRQLTRSR